MFDYPNELLTIGFLLDDCSWPSYRYLFSPSCEGSAPIDLATNSASRRRGNYFPFFHLGSGPFLLTEYMRWNKTLPADYKVSDYVYLNAGDPCPTTSKMSKSWKFRRWGHNPRIYIYAFLSGSMIQHGWVGYFLKTMNSKGVQADTPRVLVWHWGQRRPQRGPTSDIDCCL